MPGLEMLRKRGHFPQGTVTRGAGAFEASSGVLSCRGSSRPEGSSMVPPASSIADAAPELQAWLFRESNLVGGVINKRYGSLYPHIFVTSKTPGTQPTKIWPLHSDCTVSPVNYASYTIRQRGTSTIWALATGKHDTKKLVRSSPL